MDQGQIKKITELVSRFNSGIIALQNNPSVDGVAAGTALYLALSKMGKHMSIVCASKPQVELAATDKIQQSFVASGNHLVISFPYTEGAIDKVDYNISGSTFNLILVPTGESNKIDPKDVKFSYTGGKIDFIITVDVPNLNSLGPIYTENQGEFQGKNIINIDRHLINNNFGTVNVVNKSISSTSEIVYQVVKDLGVEIDKDIATNLYTGLLAATNNFTSYSVNQSTFEASAELMRYGAVKKPIPQNKPAGGFGGAPGFGAPQGGFGTPPNNPFGNPGGGFGYGGGPNPMNSAPPPQSQFGGFNNPSMGRNQPPMGGAMNSPMMDDFDDFDDFDDMPAVPPPPMPFGTPMQGGMNRPQPPMPQMQNPMGQPFPNQMQHPSAPGMNQPQQQFPRTMPQQPVTQPHMTSQPQQNMQQPMTQQQQQPPAQSPQQNQQPQQQGQQQQNNQEQKKSPQDWLKPKLFRGNDLI